MSVKLYFEVGHVAALKSKAAPNGFTHDWELFVRGTDGNTNFNRLIDKVIFNLHDSFPRPKRGKSEMNSKECEYSRHLLKSIPSSISQRVAIKEPPFTLKESGYAGFELPIEIYFKNRERTTLTYDLNLQQTATVQNVEKHSFTFDNASPEFRRKLMEYGGIPIGAGGPADDRSRDGIDDRSQLISKPKLGGSTGDSKKHKNRPISDELRPTSAFANLFGTPITKMSTTSTTSKVSPEQKISTGSSSSKNSGNNSVSNSNISSGSKVSSQKTGDKVSSKDKPDKSSKEKKDKNKYASPNREGINKEATSKKSSGFDEKRGREEKRKEKSHTKERDRSRDKIQKRPPSPKPASRSPKRSSPARNVNINRHGDGQSATQKYGGGDDKTGSSTKKSKKEKKEKDRDRERSGEKKDKESKHQSKDREVRSTSKTLDKIDGKQRDVGSSTPKEKDLPKDKKSVIDVKPSDYDHQSESKAQSTSVDTKKSDKSEKDSERKHKHKKKDKNKERDKDRSSSKERKKDKDKSSKQKDANIEISHVATISGNSNSKKIGITTSNQNVAIVQPMQQISAKITPLDAMINEMNDSDTSGTDVEMNHVSPLPPQSSKNISSDRPDVLENLGTADHHSNSAGIPPDAIAAKLILPPSSLVSHSPIPKPEPSVAKNADKASKRAAKEAAKAAEKEDKKRKRKIKDEPPQSGDDKRRSTPSPNIVNGPPPPHHTKIAKKDEQLIRLPYEKNEPQTQSPLQSNQINSNHAPTAISPAPSSSGHHNNSNDNFPSSSPGTAVTPTSTGEPYRSPVEGITVDYMAELKVLQNKIMGLQNNSELQQVVELIAETGCYEITSKTFDFDLCALDRITVQRLQEFFAQCVS